MKKLLTLLLAAVSISAMAQDILVLRDSSTISVKVIEVGTSEIKYKKWDNVDGPVYSLNRKDVLSLTYQNGSSENFENQVAPRKRKATTGFVELSPSVGLSKGTKGGLELKVGFLSRITDNFKWGLGVGARESYEFEGIPTMPVILRLEYQGERTSKASLFCHLDAGYCLNFDNFDYGSIQLNPTIGGYFNNFYLGIGYLGLIPTNSGFDAVHALNFKLGYRFGNKLDDNSPSRLKKFFKRTKFTAGAGWGIGMSSVSGKFDSEEFSQTIGTGVHADFAWTYQFNDNLDFGIGAGIRTHDYPDGFGYNKFETRTSIGLPIFARAEYTFFNKERPFRPFARVDAGYMAQVSNCGDYGFLFNLKLV